MKPIKSKAEKAKKLTSIITILIFLISIIPLASINAINASAAENVCCAKSQGNFCVYTSQDKCDPSSSLKSQLGFITSPFSCNQLADCKPVCCVTENGVCKEKTSKAQCRAQGGKPIDSADCKIPECEKGACVIANRCQYPVTSTACKSQAEKLKVKYTFDVSIKSQQECSTKYSLEEGCCVSNAQCSRTTGESCTLQKGNFFPGKLCSNQELVSQCRDHSAQYAKTCNKYGNVYYTDSKGVLENVVGSPDDGLIHNKQSDLAGKQGYCDLSRGFTCGKDYNGTYTCLDINCRAGSVIDLRGIVQYAPDIGKMFPEKHTITQEELSGKPERKNGESWCYSSSGEKTEPGTSHYVLSCQYGKIHVEPCGEFRDKICNEETITAQASTQSSARCIENRWQDCWLYGGGKDWRRNNAFYPENKVNRVSRNLLESRAGRTALLPPVIGNFLPIGTKKDKQECLLLGGNEDEKKSHCVFDKNGLNECWPKYPPGFQFWQPPASQDTLSAQRVCNRCGKGGNGKQNSCDEKECSYMGDCGFDEGWSWWQGALVGGIIGGAVGTGIAGGIAAAGGPAGTAQGLGTGVGGASPGATGVGGLEAGVGAGSGFGAPGFGGAGKAAAPGLFKSSSTFGSSALGGAGQSSAIAIKTIGDATPISSSSQTLILRNTKKGAFIQGVLIATGEQAASQATNLLLESLTNLENEQYKTQDNNPVLYSQKDGKYYMKDKGGNLYSVNDEGKITIDNEMLAEGESDKDKLPPK